jgi:6-phosphofructokinase
MNAALRAVAQAAFSRDWEVLAVAEGYYGLLGGEIRPVDRVLASRLGAAAVDALADDDSGKMVGLCGDEICRTPLDEVVGGQRPLDPELYKLAGVLSALPA